MRKILSLALVICMVFSLSTVAFADASGYSTTVTYAGTGSSEWELNVPANMLPGETKDVSLEGTWDSSTVFNVSTDASVTMGNDINNDTETLAITFNTIEAEGNNYSEISIVEPISVADMPEVLFGNWKGVFNYYLTVNKVEVVDELEQDEDGNYLVSTAQDLFTLAEIVNSGAWENEEVTVLLTDDIDLKNKPFTPIGYTKNQDDKETDYGIGLSLYGTFDGQGHTIYNLNVTATDEDINNNSSAGLFASIGYEHNDIHKETIIKNLKVDGATISGTHFAGVIAGTSAGNYRSESKIVDCEVRNATVTSTYYNADNSGDKAGIIIGTVSNSIISGCTVIDSTVIASRDAGQIAGAGYSANVTGCTATRVEVKWNGVGTGKNINNALIGRLLG